MERSSRKGSPSALDKASYENVSASHNRLLERKIKDIERRLKSPTLVQQCFSRTAEDQRNNDFNVVQLDRERIRDKTDDFRKEKRNRKLSNPDVGISVKDDIRKRIYSSDSNFLKLRRKGDSEKGDSEKDEFQNRMTSSCATVSNKVKTRRLKSNRSSSSNFLKLRRRGDLEDEEDNGSSLQLTEENYLHIHKKRADWDQVVRTENYGIGDVRRTPLLTSPSRFNRNLIDNPSKYARLVDSAVKNRISSPHLFEFLKESEITREAGTKAALALPAPSALSAPNLPSSIKTPLRDDNIGLVIESEVKLKVERVKPVSSLVLEIDEPFQSSFSRVSTRKMGPIILPALVSSVHRHVSPSRTSSAYFNGSLHSEKSRTTFRERQTRAMRRKPTPGRSPPPGCSMPVATGTQGHLDFRMRAGTRGSYSNNSFIMQQNLPKITKRPSFPSRVAASNNYHRRQEPKLTKLRDNESQNNAEANVSFIDDLKYMVSEWKRDTNEEELEAVRSPRKKRAKTEKVYAEEPPKYSSHQTDESQTTEHRPASSRKKEVRSEKRSRPSTRSRSQPADSFQKKDEPHIARETSRHQKNAERPRTTASVNFYLEDETFYLDDYDRDVSKKKKRSANYGNVPDDKNNQWSTSIADEEMKLWKQRTAPMFLPVEAISLAKTIQVPKTDRVLPKVNELRQFSSDKLQPNMSPSQEKVWSRQEWKENVEEVRKHLIERVRKQKMDEEQVSKKTEERSHCCKGKEKKPKRESSHGERSRHGERRKSENDRGHLRRTSRKTDNSLVEVITPKGQKPKPEGDTPTSDRRHTINPALFSGAESRKDLPFGAWRTGEEKIKMKVLDVSHCGPCQSKKKLAQDEKRRVSNFSDEIATELFGVKLNISPARTPSKRENQLLKAHLTDERTKPFEVKVGSSLMSIDKMLYHGLIPRARGMKITLGPKSSTMTEKLRLSFEKRKKPNESEFAQPKEQKRNFNIKMAFEKALQLAEMKRREKISALAAEKRRKVEKSLFANHISREYRSHPERKPSTKDMKPDLKPYINSNNDEKRPVCFSFSNKIGAPTDDVLSMKMHKLSSNSQNNLARLRHKDQRIRT